jgi:predicted metal-dependent phosphoesterase TrpH
MLKAELHSHSTYSLGEKVKVEGLHSPAELVAEAKQKGLDVLALTDHNCFQGIKEALRAGKKNNVLIIPGEEIKTEKGHLIGLGLQEFIKTGQSVEETIDLIHAQGGLALAPHPFDVKGEGIGLAAAQCDSIEIFNSLNIDRFSNGKARRFAARKELGTTVGSDAHFKEMIGLTVNSIQAEKDIDSVLKAIKKNKTQALQTAYVPTPWLTDWAIKRLKASRSGVFSRFRLL